MPTVIAYHEVKDTQHWLASPKREELFGPLGVTNIRTFVDPQNPARTAVPIHAQSRHRVPEAPTEHAEALPVLTM